MDELNIYADRLFAAKECRYLISRYSYYLSAFRTRELMELWANREDSVFIALWGKYFGYDGIKRHFICEMGDRTDPQVLERIKGLVMIRDMSTEMLQIAGDGETARGSWISMGQDAYIREDGKPQADWVWNKYAVEFICDNGKWKIWKMHIFPVFSSPFEKSWTDKPDYVGYRFPNLEPDAPLDKPLWHWTIDGPYPACEPDLVKPYKSYEDIHYI